MLEGAALKLHFFSCLQGLLLGAVPFPGDVMRLKTLGVKGVVTLNEPYETLVPSSMYQVDETENASTALT